MLETSTPYEPWQNASRNPHFSPLNIAQTVMIACGLKAICWTRAVSYANDNSNVPACWNDDVYRVKTESKTFSAIWDRVLGQDQRKDRVLDARSVPALYVGNATIDRFFC